eukprot:9262285-Alexandrium_andersonii.AAC.1
MLRVPGPTAQLAALSPILALALLRRSITRQPDARRPALGLLTRREPVATRRRGHATRPHAVRRRGVLVRRPALPVGRRRR